ncbi:MAG: 2-phosphosulfolactate phosphatase [Tannerella sp.]|jgi:2-phosphosulfolactate phosphatase|nr:2-phosphosulfolactate phosphatase [Tannerella sp.]
MEIDVCFSPALYPFYQRLDAVVVVVDVFRATTTIVTAFENGAYSICPVASVEEAKRFKSAGMLVGAERNVRRCSFADFGNSPFDYTPEKVKGKALVFTTTNGTKALHCITSAHRIITGAFINLQAVADYCLHAGKDVTVLCSGWEDKVNMEDILFGGALAGRLQEQGCRPAGDAAFIALRLWKEAEKDPAACLAQSEHIRRLKSNGLEKDMQYCLTFNQSGLVPVYNRDKKILTVEQ